MTANTTTTLQGAVSAGSHSQWLVLVRPQGTMEVCFVQLFCMLTNSTHPHQIWSLPKLSLVFSCNALSGLDPLLTDTYDGPSLSLPQDPPRKPQDLDVDQILVAPLGESAPRPYLFVSIAT